MLGNIMNEIRDNVIDIIFEVGDSMYFAQRYLEAEIAYRLARAISKRNRVAIMRLVELYRELSAYEEATKLLKSWLALSPKDWESQLLISELYLSRECREEAKIHLDAASHLNPEPSLYLTVLGLYDRMHGNLHQSTDNLRAALMIEETSSALLLLAENLKDSNEKAEAIEVLERVVAIAPNDPFAYQSLALFNYYKEKNHKDIQHMNVLINSQTSSRSVCRGLHFALGEIHDRLEDWDNAFLHFKMGNELFGNSFDIQILRDLVSSNIELFSEDYINSAKNSYSMLQDDPLLFIVGMPRSGSSLIEQILASHPDVFAGGERGDILEIVRYLPSNLGTNKTFPQCLGYLTTKALDQVFRPYLAMISELTGRTKCFVDKSLGNYLYIGLIAILFPQAKFIHSRRSSYDTCLSCYFKNFAAIDYTNDLETIGLVYREYERMMAHWQLVFPEYILDVDYEDVVCNHEDEIRRLLEFCGLPWNSSCLNHQQTKRVVLTCSSHQVKQPIYSKAVGRWQNYEKHLQPLISVLRH